MGTHPIFESDFDCLTEIRMSGVIRLARRELSQTQKLLATREPIDFVARPAKRVPRQHKTPATIEEYTGREPGMINHKGKDILTLNRRKSAPGARSQPLAT